MPRKQEWRILQETPNVFNAMGLSMRRHRSSRKKE
jgi:hypothetical protein